MKKNRENRELKVRVVASPSRHPLTLAGKECRWFSSKKWTSRRCCWAYAKQCVDKVAATQFTPRGPSGDANGAALAFMQLGCRVDSSGAAALVMGARAADDAMTLHDAVLGLDEIWLDDEAGVWTRERATGAGFEIARHQRAWWLVGQGLKVPLHAAGVMALVIIHAKNGTRPEFHPDWRASARAPCQQCARRGLPAPECQ